MRKYASFLFLFVLVLSVCGCDVGEELPLIRAEQEGIKYIVDGETILFLRGNTLYEMGPDLKYRATCGGMHCDHTDCSTEIAAYQECIFSYQNDIYYFAPDQCTIARISRETGQRETAAELEKYTQGQITSFVAQGNLVAVKTRKTIFLIDLDSPEEPIVILTGFDYEERESAILSPQHEKFLVDPVDVVGLDGEWLLYLNSADDRLSAVNIRTNEQKQFDHYKGWVDYFTNQEIFWFQGESGFYHFDLETGAETKLRHSNLAPYRNGKVAYDEQYAYFPECSISVADGWVYGVYVYTHAGEMVSFVPGRNADEQLEFACTTESRVYFSHGDTKPEYYIDKLELEAGRGELIPVPIYRYWLDN